MSKIDDQSVQALRENLAALREMNPIGATKAQVRSSVVYLRDVKQNLVSVWRFAGLGPSPQIEASVLSTSLPEKSSAILFGAMEKGRPRLGGPDPAGSAWPIVATGVEFIMFAEDATHYDTERDPFERRALSISQFFKGVIFVNASVRVTRYDVVEYAAYRAGAVHSHASQYHLDKVPQLRALDRLRDHPPFHTRDNVEYLLLSIARDLCEAPDIIRFIDGK